MVKLSAQKSRGSQTIRWTDDVKAWATSLRFSGLTVIAVALFIGGALIVSPNLSTYVQQQRELSELRESVRQQRQAVNEADAERKKWADPVYIRSQARDRLFYVLPGETQLSVIDDIPLPIEVREETNAKLARIDGNWARSLVTSFLSAGTTAATPDQLSAPTQGEADPTQIIDPPATPNGQNNPDGTEETPQ